MSSPSCSLPLQCQAGTEPCAARLVRSSLAPRRMMVHASPISTPEKWMSLSSPIMISSISLQLPSFTASGLSKVEAISPPASRPSFCQTWEPQDCILQQCRPFLLDYLACGKESHNLKPAAVQALIGDPGNIYNGQAV